MVVAFTSREYRPIAAVGEMPKLTVEVCPPPVTSSVVGLKLGLVISRGTLTASSLTVPVKPFLGVTVTVAEAVIPCSKMR